MFNCECGALSTPLFFHLSTVLRASSALEVDPVWCHEETV